MIRLANLSPSPQRSWVFVGAPASAPLPPGATKGAGGYWVFADMGGAEVRDVADGDVMTAPPLQTSPWILDEPDRVVPRFLCWTADGQAAWWSDKPAIISSGPFGPGMRVVSRWKIPAAGLTIDGVFDVLPGQDFVPFNLKVTFGDVGTRSLSADLGKLSMVTGERPAMADAVRKGLTDPEWIEGVGAWEQLLTHPRPWGKACRSRFRGVLLCLPAGERWDPNSQDDRHVRLRARAQGPVRAVGDWGGGNWLGFGELPAIPPNGEAAAVAAKVKFDHPDPGDDYDMRPAAQWPNAGQTGPCPDFGCSRGEIAAVLRQPWAVEDLLYQVECWGLRPTGNLELDGSPMRAENHPNCRIYNQRPAERLGTQDMLNWPDPYPWSWLGPGYTTADDQHRTDNGLVAAVTLTQDPFARDDVEDLIELDLMRVRAPLGTPIASPRDWGRTLIAWSHYVALGFDKARTLILRSIDSIYSGASYRRLALDLVPGHTVLVLSDNEEKYGYVDASNNLVRCWLPWQESIGAMGLWAAWKQTGDQRARSMAVTVSETVVRHGFSKASGQWRAAYACRWRTDDEGAPLPDEAFPLDGPTPDHFGYPMAQWMLGAVRIVERNSADAALQQRARDILAAFPVMTWDDACWQAVGP